MLLIFEVFSDKNEQNSSSRSAIVNVNRQPEMRTIMQISNSTDRLSESQFNDSSHSSNGRAELAIAPLTVDFTKEATSEKIFPKPPCSTSHNSSWNNIWVEHHQQPYIDVPDYYQVSHTVSCLLKATVNNERWLDGHHKEEMQTQGSVALLPAGVSHRIIMKGACEFLILTINRAYLNQVAQEWINPDRSHLIPHFAYQQDPLILQLALTLKTEIESGYPGGKMYGDSIANLFAIHLLRNYCTTPATIRTYEGGLSKFQLKCALDYIHANLDNQLSLETIASELSLSHYYFCSLFKQSTGVSPWQYVIRQRVERAKQLLKNSELAISEVALACGFSNQSHLNKHFNKLTGITPNRYRRG